MLLSSYSEIREWLESFIPLVYGKSEFGLARIENLLLKLGNPQKSFKSILVGGTAGKGSTAYYIARLLQYSKLETPALPAGRRNSKLETNTNSQNPNFRNVSDLGFRTSNFPTKVGLHLSPHLIYIGERMQINGKPIAVRRLVSLVNEIKPVVDAIGVSQPELLPSYFEILVALSFLYFAKEKVDFAVVEVGLGGRLDATNILESEISVITNVGLDHTELLGDTVEKIAKEKAGIIKAKVSNGSKVSKVSKGILVVTGATGKALKVIENTARLASAPVISVNLSLNRESKRVKNKKATLIKYSTLSDINSLETDIEKYVFRHYYQLRSTDESFAVFNKNLALLTVLALKMDVREDVAKRAFSGKFAGRFEEIDKNVVVDGAHNADKIKALINWIKGSRFTVHSSQKITLVIAFKKGKNWQEMVDLLMKNLSIKKIIATKYFATTDMGKGSAVAPEEIARYVKSIVDSRLTIVKIINNSQEAVIEALNSTQLSNYPANQLVLITGSLYLVGEARTLWKLPEF